MRMHLTLGLLLVSFSLPAQVVAQNLGGFLSFAESLVSEVLPIPQQSTLEGSSTSVESSFSAITIATATAESTFSAFSPPSTFTPSSSPIRTSRVLSTAITPVSSFSTTFTIPSSSAASRKFTSPSSISSSSTTRHVSSVSVSATSLGPSSTQSVTSITAAAPTTTSNSMPTHRSPRGLAAGLAVMGTILGILLVCLIVWLCWRTRRSQRSDSSTISSGPSDTEKCFPSPDLGGSHFAYKTSETIPEQTTPSQAKEPVSPLLESPFISPKEYKQWHNRGSWSSSSGEATLNDDQQPVSPEKPSPIRRSLFSSGPYELAGSLVPPAKGEKRRNQRRNHRFAMPVIAETGEIVRRVSKRSRGDGEGIYSPRLKRIPRKPVGGQSGTTH